MKRTLIIILAFAMFLSSCGLEGYIPNETDNKEEGNEIDVQDGTQSIIDSLERFLINWLMPDVAEKNSAPSVDSSILETQTAMKSDSFKISGTMMAYLYFKEYQSFYQYLSLLGADTSKSLKTQQCALSDGTWFDYIMQSAKNQGTEILSLCEQAKKNGIELDGKELNQIEIYADELKKIACQYGYADPNAYLFALTNNPVKVQDVQNVLKLSALGEKYAAKFNSEINYSKERLEQYYEDNKDSFGVRTGEKARNVRQILFSNGNYTDDTKAQEILAEFLSDKTVEKFTELCTRYSDDTVSNKSGGLYQDVCRGEMVSEFNDWLFDPERVEGDTAVIKAESTGWHIMWYIGESEYSEWELSAMEAIGSEEYENMIAEVVDTVRYYKEVVDQISG